MPKDSDSLPLIILYEDDPSILGKLREQNGIKMFPAISPDGRRTTQVIATEKMLNRAWRQVLRGR